MIGRDTLERHQVWFYLAAVAAGLLTGTLWPDAGHLTETLVWPVLALLLYATFTQMPLASIPAAFKDGRFLATALVGNFVIIPLLVWALVQLAPENEALRLGLLLVLLVPCTDWFITFSQLGRGDATRATALTPITLILQLLLLPLYLGLMADIDFASVFALADVWPALLVVLAPLGLAALTEAWAKKSPSRGRTVERFGWWPVPLLAVVILLVATAHVSAVGDNLRLLPIVVGIAVAFLAAALVIAKLLSLAFRLPAGQGRTLAFSLGTRNSFIVLPFAFSLPAGWEVTAIVIVMQSLVELFGMVFYLWFVPRILFRDPVPQH
ncbi:arsenic resistance protein [Saccharomonospora glauca]|uniref:Arsenite efflux pump ACR3-like permease n=1 Tax=Saccharomonospora glauca K62 TaxID=928724 RepID=I1CWF2_9PSEU|nr:bile acid:sodium symporter [Saccharomonospora glauca]EIE97026.1 arsenite efflux pump ACR3-like permease [Saccharomonospora glauca K62]